MTSSVFFGLYDKCVFRYMWQDRFCEFRSIGKKLRASLNMTHFMCFGQYDKFYVFRSIWQDHNPCAPRTVWWMITFVRSVQYNGMMAYVLFFQYDRMIALFPFVWLVWWKGSPGNPPQCRANQPCRVDVRCRTWLKGQVQGWGWFLTRFPLKLADNDDVGKTVIWGL